MTLTIDMTELNAALNGMSETDGRVLETLVQIQGLLYGLIWASGILAALLAFVIFAVFLQRRA